MKKRINVAPFGIIGLGRFGMALAECLAQAEREVVVVDKNESRVKEARKFTDYAFVVKTLDQTALEEAGIQNCDTVAICIGEQMDISVLTTMLVTNMQVSHVIAKANSLIHGEVLNRLGAMVVYPERDMAVRLGKKLIYDNFLDSVALQGDVEVRRIQATSRMIGVSIAEVAARQKYGLNIIAIEHDHHTDVEFPSQYQFRKEDIICVVGKVNNIERFERDMQEQ